MKTDDILKTAREAALKGGEVLIRGFGRVFEAKAKGPSDIVTEYDLMAQEAILGVIRSRFPGHGIMAEEGVDKEAEALWVVDPLDGTKNFYRGLPVFAVSIAWAVDGDIRVGVIYDPARDEMYWAVKGKGAFLNGEPIRVSGQRSLVNAFLATGFPHRDKDDLEEYLETFRLFFPPSLSIRRLGAAALDLAHLARGIYDGFWEQTLYPWDVAAGYVIITEAGGVMTRLDGVSADFLSGPGSVLAGTPGVHREMASLLATLGLS